MAPLARAALALLLALVLLAAGCDDDASGPTPVADLPPGERVERSAAAVAGLASFRIAFTAEGELSGGPAALGALEGALAAEGEGAVVAPDRASVDATVRARGLEVQLNVTRFADELAVSLFGTTAGLEVAPEDLARLDLGALYPTLAGWITAPAEVGAEEVDGAPTVRVRGELDTAAVVADLEALLGPLEPRARVALAAALADDEIELWIGTEDDLPRRVRLALDAEGPEAAEAGLGTLRVDATIGLSDFDGPVEIEDPAPLVTLDPQDLGDLLPG